MRKVFISPQAGLVAAFLVVEQAIVASSTLWLAWLADSIAAGGNALLPFIGFIGSLTLVYIPSTLKRTALARAKIIALERYIVLCSTGLNCVPHLSRSESFQREKRPAIETECFLVIDEAFDFADLFLSLLLNVAFNVSALCLAFGSELLWAYLLTAGTGIALTAASSKRVKSDSGAMQRSREGTYRALGGAWDAITLGNAYNLGLWMADFKVRVKEFSFKASAAVRNVELLTSVTLWVAVIPVAIVMSRAMFSGGSSVATKAMVLATFPRQIQVIQYIAEMVNCLLKWSAIRERIVRLSRAYHVDNAIQDMVGQVHLDRLFCHDDDGKPVSLHHFEPPKAGRLTIRGDNGSGKTSFLLQLKRDRPDRSIIVPAHSQVHFASVAGSDLSTGQKMRGIIEELNGIEPLDLVLLDEWDANLDQENIRKVDAMIGDLARRACIIEVRHR